MIVHTGPQTSYRAAFCSAVGGVRDSVISQHVTATSRLHSHPFSMTPMCGSWHLAPFPSNNRRRSATAFCSFLHRRAAAVFLLAPKPHSPIEAEAILTTLGQLKRRSFMWLVSVKPHPSVRSSPLRACQQDGYLHALPSCFKPEFKSQASSLPHLLQHSVPAIT